MRCPRCSFQDDKVVDSRSIKDGAGVRRRRVCLACGFRFTTMENILETELMVIKRDGAREDFDIAKLRRGIELACHKRPVPAEIQEKLADDIHSALQHDFDREVASEEIGSRVMEALRGIDQVAYVRFASIYRQFQDVDGFIDEIRTLR